MNQSTLIRDCRIGQDPLWSTCHLLTLKLNSWVPVNTDCCQSVKATASSLTSTFDVHQAFLSDSFNDQRHHAAGNQMNRESTQLIGLIIVSNLASVAFLRPCFCSAAPSNGRQTTFTNPLDGLYCSFSLTALKRLEAYNSSVYMACTQNFCVSNAAFVSLTSTNKCPRPIMVKR